MRRVLSKAMLVCATAGAVMLAADWVGPSGVAQNPSSLSSARATADSSALKRQRSVAIYNYKTTAESGWARGEEIYYIKCWMCHNEYTVKAKTGAVHLKDLYKRPRLISGEAVNDRTVAEKIRNGGPGMPAYRHTLSDADMADLLRYLREGHCCFEGSEPPRNPAYRY